MIIQYMIKIVYEFFGILRCTTSPPPPPYWLMSYVNNP